MDQERWKQIDAVFERMLEIEPGERADALARMCAGDDDLRRRVEVLLNQETPAEDFLKSSAIAGLAGELAGELGALTPGQRISHYRIESRIGAGGMGEVWKARDEHLNRDVAIKVLPPEFSADPEWVRRFEQEAFAVSALNHPNIITIYDFGQARTEAGNLHFIVTELIEGKTLRALGAHAGSARSQSALEACAPGRAPRWREAVLIATQIAEALNAAHTVGIIHRDIKPENIMVLDNRLVKTLDFGIAKRVNAAAVSGFGAGGDQSAVGIHTRLGARPGTVKYMSPEQARGEQLDARTDVFSLGLVLYEMIAGRRPYDGMSDEEIIEALKSEDEIPPVAGEQADIPAALDRIVTKATRKRREERYSSGGEMLADLERLRSLIKVGGGEKEERMLRARNADQLLTQFVVFHDANPKTRVPLGSLWTIWRFAGMKRGALEREVMKRSLLDGLARTGWRLLLVAAMTMIVIAPMSVVEAWMEEIVRDGHKSAARRVAISPDGRLLATSGVDYEVIIWEFARRERVKTLSEHTDIVGALAFAPDGKWLVTGSHDQRLIVWDTLSWRKIKEMSFQEGRVSAADFSPDGSRLAASILGASTASTLVWRTSDWFQVGKLPIAAHWTARLIFAHDGRRLIFTKFYDNLSCAWDIATGKPVGRSLNAEWGGATGAFSSDGALLVTLDDNGMVSFIDPERGRLLNRQQAHNFSGRAAVFSPDGRLVATGANDIVLWEARTRTLLARLEHTDNVWSLGFSPDGRWLVSSHGDGAILLWDVADRRRIANFNEHSGPVRKVIFSPNGNSLVSGGDDGTAIVWDRASLRKQAVLTGHEDSVREQVFNSHAGAIATVDGTATVRVWDVTQRQSQEAPRLKAPNNYEYNMADAWLSPDLRWLMTSFAVYERAIGRMVCDNRVISGHQRGFVAAAFSSDGQRLIGIGANKQVSLLETGTWRVLAQRQAADVDATKICFSPDGELLAIGDGRGMVWLWSVNPLQSLAQLGRHEAYVEAVVFSPDGSRVASASDDRTICLWDAGGRELITRIGTHSSAINSLAFSPDGRQLLSGEHDGTVRLYTRHRALWGWRWD
ncbi:MAG: serine/threonine-protein kinase [Blastocatellales bacterium]